MSVHFPMSSRIYFSMDQVSRVNASQEGNTIFSTLSNNESIELLVGLFFPLFPLFFSLSVLFSVLHGVAVLVRTILPMSCRLCSQPPLSSDLFIYIHFSHFTQVISMAAKLGGEKTSNVLPATRHLAQIGLGCVPIVVHRCFKGHELSQLVPLSCAMKVWAHAEFKGRWIKRRTVPCMHRHVSRSVDALWCIAVRAAIRGMIGNDVSFSVRRRSKDWQGILDHLACTRSRNGKTFTVTHCRSQESKHQL